MLTTHWRKEEPSPEEKHQSQWVEIISKTFTFLWVGTLSSEFFPIKYVVLFTIVALVVAFLFFYHRLENFYKWFELHFLSNFQKEPDPPMDSESSYKHLVPWDAHLVTLEVHPNSSVVLKRISEVDFRVRHGVNIVAIQRGEIAIVTPLPQEILLPKDKLILLGTDEQVEKVQLEIKASNELKSDFNSSSIYELRRADLSKNCVFVGKTIRQSGFREYYNAMVVGIEREGLRKINPDSDFQLRKDDILWITGERKKLEHLVSALTNE